MRLISIGWTPVANQKWHSALGGCGSEGRESFQWGGDLEGFQSPRAASQRRGRYVHWLKRAKLLGGGVRQKHRADREVATGRGWSCPQDTLLRISLACIWCSLGGGGGQTEGLIGTWGSTSIQRVTRHKNKTDQLQNTTYSPAKADPPGTQCTKAPWWSWHLTCWSTQFWDVHTGQWCENYFSSCALSLHNVKWWNLIVIHSTPLPFSPPAAGTAAVCFWVSYEGPMFARSCRDINHTLDAHKHSLQPEPFCVVRTAQQLSGTYLIQQAELGVLLLWVFAARVRVLLHQENISLFTLEKKQNLNTLSWGNLLRSQVLPTDCLGIQSSTLHRILPSSSLYCWATWAFPVSDELSCTPSTCQWTVWCPAGWLEQQDKEIQSHNHHLGRCWIVP